MTDEVLQAPATENPAELKPEAAPADGVNTGAPVEETDEEKNKRIQDEAAEASRQREEKRRASVQRRMDELTAEKYEARKQLQEAMEQNKRMLAMLEGKNAAPAESGEPKRDQFESYEDYVTARAEFRAEQKAQAAVQARLEQFQRESKEAQTRTAQETEARAVEQAFLKARQEAEKQFPDFRQVVDGWEPQIPAEVADLILRLPDGPSISYHLAKTPALEAQLREAPRHLQAVILGEIRSALKSSSAKETAAPAPGKPVGSRAAPSNEMAYTGDPEGYYAWARKHLK